MRKLLFLYIFLGAFALTSCQVPPLIAQMQANISISSEGMDSQNAVANVNFNEVTKEVIDGKAIIAFSNADGYSIQFQLIGANPSSGEYSMANGNSLSGSFVLTRNGQQITASVVSTSQGFLNINSINVSDNSISSMVGSFDLNVTSGNEEQEADGRLIGTISF